MLLILILCWFACEKKLKNQQTFVEQQKQKQKQNYREATQEECEAKPLVYFCCFYFVVFLFCFRFCCCCCFKRELAQRQIFSIFLYRIFLEYLIEWSNSL